LIRYLARRTVHAVLVLFLISVAAFLLVEIAPGTYVDEMRLNPRLSPETIKLLKSRYGLDQPLPVRYLHWLRSAVRGEFGFSFSYGIPAGDVIWPRARNTFVLTLAATASAWFVAILLAVLTSMPSGAWLMRVVRPPLALLQSIPDVLIALLLLLAAVRLHWSRPPRGALAGASVFSSGTADHLLLPVLALTLILLPTLARHAQAAIGEALTATHIQAARALGIPAGRFWTLYVLPSAANPLISLLGLSIGNLLSASILVEIIMGWPGAGPMLLEAIFSRDVSVVVGCALLAAAFLIAGNLAADLLLWFVDPRIHLERQCA